MEYRYITPENISTGEITVSCAEASEEAKSYNNQMAAMMSIKDSWVKISDFFRTLHLITYLMTLCIFFKPFIFPEDTSFNIGASIIAGAGYFYFVLRYWHGVEGYNAPIAAALVGVIGVSLSIILLKGGYSFNSGVAFFGTVVCTLFMIFYVLFPTRYSLGISLLGCCAYIAVSWMPLFYVVLIAVTAFIMERKDSVMRASDGYPEFRPLKIRNYTDGKITVRSYDGYNRFDGIDDEMESI